MATKRDTDRFLALLQRVDVPTALAALKAAGRNFS